MVDLEDWRVFILVICDHVVSKSTKANRLVRLFVFGVPP